MIKASYTLRVVCAYCFCLPLGQYLNGSLGATGATLIFRKPWGGCTECFFFADSVDAQPRDSSSTSPGVNAAPTFAIILRPPFPSLLKHWVCAEGSLPGYAARNLKTERRGGGGTTAVPIPKPKACVAGCMWYQVLMLTAVYRGSSSFGSLPGCVVRADVCATSWWLANLEAAAVREHELHNVLVSFDGFGAI